MKNLIFIFSFLAVLIVGIAPKANSQVSGLTPVSITPAGPYHCGQIITVEYNLDYTLPVGSQISVTVAYDNTQLQLLNFTPFSSNLFLPPSTVTFPPTINTNTYLTNPASGNNFTTTTGFTISFMVSNCGCSLASSDITVTASSIPVPSTGNDLITVATPVNIDNPNSNPTITMEIIGGSPCSGTAMFKITTVGMDVDNTSGNSTISLTLPSGVSPLSGVSAAGLPFSGVYNSNGSSVSPAQIPSGTSTIYSWSRSGLPVENVQIHYVVLQFDLGILCAGSVTPFTADLGLNFLTHSICTGVPVSITPSPLQVSCPCPSGIIGGGMIFPGGEVFIKKTLVKFPFRYLPSDDNCMTHDYYIEVKNISNEDLSAFHLEDLLADIVPSYPNAILVTDIQVSLSSLMGLPSTFYFITNPGGNIISSITSPGSLQSLYITNPSTFPNALAWWSSPQTWSIDQNASGGTIVFPKWGSLIVKITHRLDDNAILPATHYINKANLSFSVNNISYSGTVLNDTVQDSYDPVISIEKDVKLSTDPVSSYTSNIDVDPGTTVDFRIRIRNYGMSDVTTTNLNDVITNSIVSNFGIPDASSVSVAGSSEYSIPEIALIKSVIQNGINSSTNLPAGYTCNPITLKAAPCPGFTELVITYTVPVTSNIACNSDYINTATLNWDWPAGTPHSVSDAARVNVDLFRHISYKLEATCDSVNTPWVINTINGVPGQTIWYKATVQNNSLTNSVSGLRMMVQLPYGGNSPPNNNSTQGTLNFQTTPFSAPPGSGLTPLWSDIKITPGGGFSYPNRITDNWLTGSAMVGGTPGVQSIYRTVSLAPLATATIYYFVTVPNNGVPNSSAYNTAFGVSLFAGTPCPIVKKRELNLKVMSSNSCDTLSKCSIVCDKKIHYNPGTGTYTVTLSNIASLAGFNISNMDILVHQPYKQCLPWPITPYNKTMIPYQIGTVPIFSSYPVLPTVIGQRFYNFTNVGTGSFGNITFDINTPIGAGPVTGCPIVIPINMVFKDSTNECTLCEDTFYFWVYDADMFVIH